MTWLVRHNCANFLQTRMDWGASAPSAGIPSRNTGLPGLPRSSEIRHLRGPQ